MYLDLLIALQIILSWQLSILFKLVEILDVNFMPHACELISQVLELQEIMEMVTVHKRQARLGFWRSIENCQGGFIISLLDYRLLGFMYNF